MVSKSLNERLLYLAFFLSLPFASATYSQTVNNGNFELPGSNAAFGVGSNFPGWTVTQGIVVTNSLNPFDGAYRLLFVDGAGVERTSAIQQTITGFSTGQTYTLMLQVSPFFYPNGSGTTPLTSLQLSIGGITQQYTLTPLPEAQALYGLYSIAFVARGPSEVLSISSTESGYGAVAIDALAIVPEPSGAILSLMGISVVIGAMTFGYARRGGLKLSRIPKA